MYGTYHSAISDQANKSVFRQKTQAHDEGVLERSKAVLFLAEVHDIEEDWRSRSRS